MKIFKRLLFLILTVIILNLNTIPALAATATIKATASKSTVVVGSSVTVSIKVSSSSPLGSWSFDVDYDKTILKLTSSTNNRASQVDVAYNSTTYNKTYSYTFSALKSGKASVTIKNASVIGWDYSDFAVTTTAASINVITQAELIASYSSNNNLASLSIDGAILSPEFSKDVTTYSVELVPETTKVNINATLSDAKATLVGNSEVAVVDGPNILNIVVTAENGTTKTYTINANVKELNPVELSNEIGTFTVIRKKGLYEAPINFEEAIVEIDKEKVLAYKNNYIGYVIGLKDKDGIIKLYTYDENTKKFELYNYLDKNNINIYLKEKELNISKYKIRTLAFESFKTKAYTYNDKYYLIYGIDTLTGDESFYSYDKERDTLQRFDDELIIKLNNEINQKNMIIIIIISAISLIIVSGITFVLIKKYKKKR